MALVRQCDRCHAAADPLELATTTRTIVVPAADLATNPVAADVPITLGIQVTGDLCAPCFVATLFEYAVARFGGAVLTPPAVAGFIARLRGLAAPL